MIGEEQKFTITLAVAQINLILAGLAELPYKISVPLIAEIQKQLKEQLEPAKGPKLAVES